MTLYNNKLEDLEIEYWMSFHDAVFIGDYSISLKITKLENGKYKQLGTHENREIDESILERP